MRLLMSYAWQSAQPLFIVRSVSGILPAQRIATSPRRSGCEGRTQAAPADDDARDGEQKAEGAEPDDQAVAQQRMRDEDRKIQRVQRAVEPAIGPPRWIQPLQQIAVGAVDIEPELAAVRAVDRAARDGGLRGIIVVVAKCGRCAAAGREARGQP